jgi:cytidylate kinase
MGNNFIITIGRQYGSGGREIGEKLAKQLSIPFYDKELLAIASNESGIDAELFEKADEKPKMSFLYSLVTGNEKIGRTSSEDTLFLAQFDAIKKVAAQGPCVIVGRCSDYILSDFGNCINIFVHANMESKKQRVINEYGVASEHAEDTIIKTDKKRAKYYNYYTNQAWGNSFNYDLTIDTSSIGIDRAVELIKKYIELLGVQ